jgi:hypothetical protein
MLVPSALDQHIKHFALGINGAPKKGHAAGDFQMDLIQMPNGVADRFAGVAENEGPRPSGFVQFQRRKAQSASPVFDDGQAYEFRRE